MITFKGIDLKQQFVVVKYKYKNRYFLPRHGSKDSRYHYKAKIFKSEEEAKTCLLETRANRKGHKYRIEKAESYLYWGVDRDSVG